MLFFFAGYEIDFERIRGQPLKLALVGWVLSLALAYALGGLLGLVRARPLHALRGVGDGNDRDRHADPDPRRRRGADHPLRHLPAGRRRRRRVRADPADHLLLLDRYAADQRPDPDALHRRRGPCGSLRDPLDRRRLGDVRGRAGDELATADPDRRGPDLHARVPRQPPRPGPAARRLRRRRDRAAGAARPRGHDPGVEAGRGRLRVPDPVLLRRQRHAVRPPGPARRSPQDCTGADLRRALPGRPRGSRDDALPEHPRPAGSGWPWRSSAPPSCRWSSRSRRSRSPRIGCERRRQRHWSGRRSSRPRSIHSSACACVAHETIPRASEPRLRAPRSVALRRSRSCGIAAPARSRSHRPWVPDRPAR